jgi:16S rRNA G966 N2-methylase RsmD
VENHPAAVRLIRENLASLEIKSEARIIATAVAPALEKLHKDRAAVFDFIFLDPPYANKNDYELTLDSLAASSLVSESSILIAEHSKKSPLAKSIGGLEQFRLLTQGDASLSFYRLA